MLKSLPNGTDLAATTGGRVVIVVAFAALCLSYLWLYGSCLASEARRGEWPQAARPGV